MERIYHLTYFTRSNFTCLDAAPRSLLAVGLRLGEGTYDANNVDRLTNKISFLDSYMIIFNIFADFVANMM